MAIITNKLKHLLSEAFISELQSAGNNLYFFIGKSTPWKDSDAITGQGLLTTVGTIITYSSTFSTLMEGATIKNLDTNEIRYLNVVGGDSTGTINAPGSFNWNTSNWQWKPAIDGSIWIDDNNPPIADTSNLNLFETDNDILALKRLDLGDGISYNNVYSFVIPRYDYEKDTTVYAPYEDNDGQLLNHPDQSDIQAASDWNSSAAPADQYIAGSHCVLVKSGSNIDIFKCLENGGIHNKSTVTPNKASCNAGTNWIHSATDGYKWQFMYSLSADQSLNFLSDSWIPVRKALITDIGDSEQNQFLVQASASSRQSGIGSVTVIDAPIEVLSFGVPETGSDIGNQTNIPTLLANEVKLSNYVGSGDFTGYEFFAFTTPTQKRIILSYDNVTKIATLDSSVVDIVSTTKICVAPAVTITGQFYGTAIATARALVGPGDTVSEIVMLNQGAGYRNASAICTVGQGLSLTLVATIKPQIAPTEGHGGDAVKELGGFNVMLHCQIRNIEGFLNTPAANSNYDFMSQNDYRTVGIIRNVQDPLGNIPTDSTLKAVNTIELTTGILGPLQYFLNDEIIECRHLITDMLIAKAKVVQHTKYVDGLITYDTVSYIQDELTGFDTLIAGTNLVAQVSGTTCSISGIVPSEIKHFSGDILYIEQREPVNRQDKQLEDVKIVLEF